MDAGQGDEGGGEVTCSDRGVDSRRRRASIVENPELSVLRHRNRKTLLSPKILILEILENLFLIVRRHVQLSGLWVKQPYYRPL